MARFFIVSKDICPYLHAMSDMGWDEEKGHYSRHHTNNMECYAELNGKKCSRRGRCLTVKTVTAKDKAITP